MNLIRSAAPLFFYLFIWAISSSRAFAQTASSGALTIPVSTAAFSAPAASTEAVAASTASAPAEARDVTPGPWIVGAVALEGNKNVKDRTIFAQIQAKRGQIYHRADVNRDIQSLLGMGGFERVTVDVSEIAGTTVPDSASEPLASSQTVKLIYKVKEKPVVRRIRFEGNDEVGKSKLTDTAATKEGDPFDDFKARQDIDKILEVYREKGYNDAKAEFKVETDTGAPSSVDLSFKIAEGKKTVVKSVRIEGAEAFSEKKLARRMENSPGWIFSTAYQPKKLDEDKASIERFYLSRGYLDFKVLSSTVDFSADRSEARITLKIQEGRQYHFGAAAVSGNTLYGEEELLKALDCKEGRVFDQERFQEGVMAIQELYANKGRLHARITHERRPNARTGFLDMALKVEEGPVVYVGHVDIEGNKTTKTYVLKREATIKSGDAFSAKKVQRSREKIMNLGFIDNVDLDLVPNPSDPGLVDLTFTVLEGKPGMLTAGAGFSSLDGLVGTMSLSHLNLFGRAQSLSVSWQFGSRVQDYQISWNTPWINNHPTSLGTDVYNTSRLRPFSTSISAFTDKRTGGRLRLGPRFEDDLYRLNLSYTLESVNITSIDTSIVTGLTPGRTLNSTLGVELARDSRDNIWDPTTGSRHSVGLNYSGGPLGGQLDEYRLTLNDAWNFKTFQVGDYPFVLSFFNRIGYVDRFGSTPTVPVFERFFIGGQDTLRGYAINGEVGPPNGGKVFDVFNTELKFPLAQEHRHTIVAWVFFIDVGGAWNNFHDLNLHIGPTTDNIKADAGFGIRFTTPAFPIRLDWGWGFNHRPNESKFNVNFGIGNLF